VGAAVLTGRRTFEVAHGCSRTLERPARHFVGPQQID